MKCCEILQTYKTFNCEQCSERGIECPDNPFHFGKDIGIRIQDGGSSYLRICFCPFCGQRLSDDNPGARKLPDLER